MPRHVDPVAQELDELVHRAEADRRARQEQQQRMRARSALKSALSPLIGFSGPDDPRQWEEEYAGLVIEAARVVGNYTGWKTLRAMRPPKTPGFRVAHELFRLAYSGYSVSRLAAKVGAIMEPLQRARSWEGRIALNDYYEWLWRDLCQTDPVQARAPRRSGAGPANSKAFQAGYKTVCSLAVDERIDVERVIELYALPELDPGKFSKSSRYVQTAGKPMASWRLPHVPKRWGRLRDGRTRQFRPARWWTAEEVRRAMEGVAKRDGIVLRPPRAF